MKKTIRKILSLMLITVMICVMTGVNPVAFALDTGNIATWEDLKDGMDQASDGDTLIITSDIYVPENESLGFADKRIIIQKGSEDCSIYFGSSGTTDTVIQNITFDGGSLTGSNAFIQVQRSCTVKKCTFQRTKLFCN